MFTARSLSEDTKETFQFIHGHFFEGKKRVKDLEIVRRKYEETSKYEDKLCYPLYHKATALLKHFGYTKFNEQSVYFEFQRKNYATSTENKDKNKDFIWHYDDSIGFFPKVYTVIFYIRKDPTVKGGNLLYDLEETKQVNIRKVEIEEGHVVLFRGDTYHSPEPSSGFGCRDAIIVFVERCD